MSREIDISRPGPAGLYFDHDSLTDAGKASDRTIMASLERFCCACGSVGASRGFGVIGNEPGFWACGSDPECLQEASRKAREARSANPSPSAAPSSAKPASDLFSGAAA